jgi:hypothetical protein
MADWGHPRSVIDYAHAKEVLPTARARLFAIPGVHAVGVGRKIVAGQFTDEPAIMVFVEQKKPLASLAPQHVIPSDINGVKTDVYESAIPHHATNPDPPPDASPHNPLIGGCQIMPGGLKPAATLAQIQGIGGWGTLGFFIRSNEVLPLIFAVTNCHVVGMNMVAQTTNLGWTPDDPDDNSPTRTFKTSPPNQPVTPGTVVVISVVIDSNPRLNTYYATGPSDTTDHVAQMLADGLTALGTSLNNGLSGQPSGSAVMVQLENGTPSVTVQAFGPQAGDINAKTKAAVLQTSANPPVTTITFSGDMDKFGGAYVTVNTGGTAPTRGLFVTSTDSTDAMAGELATAVLGLHIDGVEAEPSTATTVEFKGIQEMECQFTSDRRVGQPDNKFCTSWCSYCCDRSIGEVKWVSLQYDVALIQLHQGVQYLAEVANIGPIVGVRDVTQDAPGTKYLLRGRSSPTVNSGTLLAFNVNGVIKYSTGFATESNPPAPGILLQRYYTNAFKVVGAPFARDGDSGSAIVTAPPGPPTGNDPTSVVGLLFGASAVDAGGNSVGLGTPIQAILDAAVSEGGLLDPTVETADAVNQTKTVPGQANAPLPPALARVAHRAVPENAAQSARLTQVQSEIGATPGGQLYGPLIMRHLNEAQTLVNTNRKMATVWHRNGGPTIANGFVRMLENPGQRVPSTINGTPLEDCLQQIASALARYGSDALAADIETHERALIPLVHLTYPELLAALGPPATVSA